MTDRCAEPASRMGLRVAALAGVLAVLYPHPGLPQNAPTPTVTTLTAAPATVAYQKPITLTASVRTSNGGAVTVGQVIFCAAAAMHCNAVQNLGLAQLNGNGSAVLRLAPGTIGSHSFTAIFLGRTGFVKSTSTAQSVTVTGIYPSSTTIASTGVPGSYGLTGTVTGLGTRQLAPTGIVSFNDTTNPTPMVLGTASLGAATLGFTAVQPPGSPNAVGGEPYGAATGDFNGDGFVDLVVQNYSSGNVSVLLGNGDGTFNPQVTYAVGALPERVLVADFNGDGILDLVVANTASQSVSILLGNGDGTFQQQVTYGAGSPVGLAVMDLNHDGIADIVAGDYYDNTVSVLLGNGDGTFQTAVTYRTGSTPQTLAEGDFNGDGNVDLAVGNLNDNSVGIFLGNGDGTFQAQVTYPVGSHPQGVQVGDFNGDGIEDLAVSNSGDNNISILLGKGDGTFQPQVTYPVGADPVGLAVADFNGDGYLDLSVGNTAPSALTQSILLGNGDGTFQPQTTYPAGNFPYGEAVGDFNGDGYPDLAISNFVDGTSTILLSQVTQTATATVTGISVGSAGTHPVDASYPGDANFSASVSATTQLTGGGGTAPVVTAIAPTETAAGTQSLTVSINGSNFNAASVVLANGAAIPTTLVSATKLTATVPAADLVKAGTLPIAVQNPAGDVNSGTSAALPLTVVPDLVLATIAPTQLPLDAASATLTLTGQNFTSTTVVQFSGTALATTVVSATQLTAVLPVSVLTVAGVYPVTAFDPASGSVSNAAQFTVLGTPNVIFSGPSTVQPGGQPPIVFQIAQAYSLPINGLVTVTFTPATGLPNDPTILLANGTRTLSFTLAAGSTATPSVMLQAGTTAGTITVSLQLTANGIPVTTVAPIVIQVPKTAPVITSVAISYTTNTVVVITKGISTTRELTGAGFSFLAVPGASFSKSVFPLSVAPLFVTWYDNPESDAYGTAFTYTQIFDVSGSPTSVASVAVNLTNTIGTSATVMP